jgi:hypothetical protein
LRFLVQLRLFFFKPFKKFLLGFCSLLAQVEKKKEVAHVMKEKKKKLV